MAEIYLRGVSEQRPTEKKQYEEIDKALAGGGGGGGSGVTKAYVDAQDDAIKVDVQANTDNITTNATDIEELDARVTAVEAGGGGTSDVTKEYVDTQDASIKAIVDANTASIATNTTDIATNVTNIAELDTRVTAIENNTGGSVGVALITLDINDYIDTVTNTVTINCQDLDSSVEVLNLVYPPTTSEATVKSALEVFLINISLTKIKTITFAPTASIVTSSINKDYKKVLDYFRFKCYKTTIEEEQMYSTPTSGRIFIAIRDTGFGYISSDTLIERITHIGLYKKKYTFYFERDILTDDVIKLFFFDANVIFSTRLDTGLYDQRFVIKLNYSICLFVDVAIMEFAFHNEDTRTSLPLGGAVDQFDAIAAVNQLIKSDGTTEIETSSYSVLFGNTFKCEQFFFSHLSYVTNAYLNSGRLLNMQIKSQYNTDYGHQTFLQIGDGAVYFQGSTASASSDHDYRNCTLKSVKLLTFRGRAIITPVNGENPVISILPILYMNAYFYES